MKSRGSVSIEGITVKNIRIYSFELAHPLVSKTVKIRFKKVLDLLTELLVCVAIMTPFKLINIVYLLILYKIFYFFSIKMNRK